MQVILESIASSSQDKKKKKKGLYRHVYTGHRATVEVVCTAFTRSLSASSLSSYGTELASKEALPRELLLPSELAQQRRHRSSNGGGEVFEDHEQDLSREHPRISSTTYYSPTIV